MNDYWKKYYASLEGATVIKFNGETPYGFPSFTVKFADGYVGKIEISQDPEGNGGGFIFGLISPN
jgi:hypothetical protein